MSKSVDPGKDETVYIYVGEELEDTVTITALINPGVEPEKLLELCIAWQNAEPSEENPLEAEFLIGEPSKSVGNEANIVRVTCGDSEVALKIIVVKIDLVKDIRRALET